MRSSSQAAPAAFLMRAETELVLKSRRVVPTRLLESGFRFDHPAWPQAAIELCSRSSGVPTDERRSPQQAAVG